MGSCWAGVVPHTLVWVHHSRMHSTIPLAQVMDDTAQLHGNHADCTGVWLCQGPSCNWGANCPWKNHWGASCPWPALGFTSARRMLQQKWAAHNWALHPASWWGRPWLLIALVCIYITSEERPKSEPVQPKVSVDCLMSAVEGWVRRCWWVLPLV